MNISRRLYEIHRRLNKKQQAISLVHSFYLRSGSGLDGVGLIQLAGILVADHLRSGKLVEVLSDMRPAPVPVSLVYPHQRFLSPAMRAFADWAAALFRNAG